MNKAAASAAAATTTTTTTTTLCSVIHTYSILFYEMKGGVIGQIYRPPKKKQKTKSASYIGHWSLEKPISFDL